MYITKDTNFKILANQNSDHDLTPQVIRVEKVKSRDGVVEEVLFLKLFCRVDRNLIVRSDCDKIDMRLSKHDLSFYRSKSKLTQTKVALAKIKENRREEKEASDDGPVQRLLKNRQEKRKDRRRRRKNRREERKNRRKNSKNKRSGSESLFSRDKKDSGDRKSRRRGGFKNRDRKSKKERKQGLGFVDKVTKRKGRKRRVKTSMKSKVLLEPKSLLLTAKSSPKFRLLKNQDIYSSAKFLSSINFGNKRFSFDLRRNRIGAARNSGVSKSARRRKLLEPDTILQINKANYSNASRFRPIYRTKINAMRAFQRQYLNMVDSSIDPLFLFENSFQKASFNQLRSGTADKVSSNTKNRKILPVVREIQRQIALISSSRYDFKKIKDPSRYKVLESFARISLEDLKDLGNNAYILFIAKDSNGLNLQAQSFSFRVSDVLNQIIRQSTEVKCQVSRTPKGVCKLNVSNLKSSLPADVNIEVKKIKRQDNFVESGFEKIISRHMIPKNSSLKIVDGNINTKRRTPVNFKACDNLFFRTTINYRGKKYYNANSASSKGVRGSKKNDNIPTLNIVAKINTLSRGMLIEVNQISSNVNAVKLKKYRYTGSSKGKLRDTVGSKGVVNEFFFLNSEDSDSRASNSVNFIDNDVFDGKVYMYVVECIMKNGERKLATDYFIEKYEDPTETAKISNVRIQSPSFIPDASAAAGNDNQIARQVTITFNVKKIETEVDKVINNMFGNLFDIFSDDLKRINDVQGLVYSIEIQRIEEKSGCASTIGKVTADNSGRCVFVDTDAPAFSNITYKMIPRVRPAKETIDAIVSQTPFLAKKTIDKPINFVSSAARINAKNRNEKIFTAKKDKYNDRQLFKKGRIRTPKDVLQQNSEDLFSDASTGDIAYATIGGLSDTRLFDNIEVRDGSINEIRHSVNPVLNLTNGASSDKKYFELQFETNNDFLVDFYAVFVKEGKNIYLDGAMQSEDSFRQTKEYSYLIEHVGAAGVAEYYIVPILKTGKILAPKLVTAQIVE